MENGDNVGQKRKYSSENTSNNPDGRKSANGKFDGRDSKRVSFANVKSKRPRPDNNDRRPRPEFQSRQKPSDSTSQDKEEKNKSKNAKKNKKAKLNKKAKKVGTDAAPAPLKVNNRSYGDELKEYLEEWHKKEDSEENSWKFNKKLQYWATASWSNSELISDEVFSLLLPYLASITGQAKAALLSTCNETIESSQSSENPDEVKVNRAKEIVEELSEE